MPIRTLRLQLGVASAAFLLLTAACGAAQTTTSPPPATSPPAADPFPVVVDAGGRSVTVAQRPSRIASLSATHTEILYAIGAGDQVVATDLFSDYPPDTATTEKVDAFSLNVEAVAALQPDLVILAFDPGDAVDGLSALGIPVLLFDAPGDLKEAYSQMLTLGRATGHEDDAGRLVESIGSQIGAIVASVPATDEPLSYYHELDATGFTVTSNTFFGVLYGLLGLQNIADPADPDGFGYPQLSPEYIIDSNPDFIFLADTKCCGESAATVAARPGWDTLAAVRSGRVVELDDDVASRWGPRLVDFLTAVADAVRAAPAADG